MTSPWETLPQLYLPDALRINITAIIILPMKQNHRNIPIFWNARADPRFTLLALYQ
jgi:hypothetical protein